MMTNPNKLDVTKLDKQAAELGYSYRRGIKPGAGYNIVDDISGDMPLGDDYTTPLKAVKEYFDNIGKQLKAKAKAPGYSFERDCDEDRDGYVLVEDSTGEIVLGDGYTATLRDIRAFLDNVASDLDAEVETSAKVAKVKLPSRQKLAAALRSHSDAKEIKELMKSAKVADPTGPTLQDLMFEERARESRKRHAIEEKWKTNLDSVRDPWHEQDYDEAFNLFRDGERDRREWLQSIERENAAFLAPETGGYDAPKPATGFKVVSKGRRKVV
jgi:hypothetical protein